MIPVQFRLWEAHTGMTQVPSVGKIVLHLNLVSSFLDQRGLCSLHEDAAHPAHVLAWAGDAFCKKTSGTLLQYPLLQGILFIPESHQSHGWSPGIFSLLSVNSKWLKLVLLLETITCLESLYSAFVRCLFFILKTHQNSSSEATLYEFKMEVAIHKAMNLDFFKWIKWIFLPMQALCVKKVFF